MALANRNLGEIIRNEKFAGRDLSTIKRYMKEIMMCVHLARTIKHFNFTTASVTNYLTS